MSENIIKFKFIEISPTLGFNDREALLNIILSDMQRNGFNILSVKDHNILYEQDDRHGFMVEYRENN